MTALTPSPGLRDRCRAPPSQAQAVAASESHSLLLHPDGTVWSAGGNGWGELGDGSNTSSWSRVQVLQSTGGGTSPLTGVEAIAVGTWHSLFLKSDGSVWATGRNHFGQLGDGSNTNRNSAVPLTGLSNIVAIAAGNSHSLFLSADGSVWATGYNNFGQLSDGTTIDRNTPARVQVADDEGVLTDLTEITAIAASNDQSLFLKSDGTVWGAGRNGLGELGNGSTAHATSAVPVQIDDPLSGLTDLTDVSALAAGSHHSLFLKNDGTVWATGNNTDGALGNGTTTRSTVAQQVLNLPTIVAIAAAGPGQMINCTAYLWPAMAASGPPASMRTASSAMARRPAAWCRSIPASI